MVENCRIDRRQMHSSNLMSKKSMPFSGFVQLNLDLEARLSDCPQFEAGMLESSLQNHNEGSR